MFLSQQWRCCEKGNVNIVGVAALKSGQRRVLSSVSLLLDNGSLRIDRVVDNIKGGWGSPHSIVRDGCYTGGTNGTQKGDAGHSTTMTTALHRRNVDDSGRRQ
ncbi:hypothetical protein CEXT_634561 [Caerostris extrusa]|uniref:Uncharacterized protein n=1 Tax=Caerostris extrusa TaxID=172846 RepID=A0AAV4U6L4_CAEEX|nr:hypothetical protein CEXT_634561 [Caerostris extrusa]